MSAAHDGCSQSEASVTEGAEPHLWATDWGMSDAAVLVYAQTAEERCLPCGTHHDADNDGPVRRPNIDTQALLTGALIEIDRLGGVHWRFG